MFEHFRQGAVDVVSGKEPLNSEFAEGAARAFRECMKTGQPRIVFDLENIPLIDSDGLELLLDIRDECRLRGGTIQLAAPNKLCHDILLVTTVIEDFEVFDDVLSAVGSFAI
jgi:anti-sigma B factor antagonist